MDSANVGVGDAQCAQRGDVWRTMPERAHNADPANRRRENFREERPKLGAVVVRHDDIGLLVQVR